jgi:hypothetical protein
MKITTSFSLIVFLLTTAETYAQDFDSDSVYYTPIPSSNEKQARQRGIFHDTVENDRQYGYFFNLQVGSLVGCNDCSEGKEITFTASTIHGVTIGKKFRTGVGIGLDSYYNWQTMPVFISISTDVFGTKNTNAIFIQINYGWSQSWRNDPYEEYGLKDTDGGTMFGTQLGYRIKYHDIKISLSIGTKYQRVYTNYEYPTYYYTEEGVMKQGTPSTTIIQQSMNRFMFALTIGWK